MKEKLMIVSLGLLPLIMVLGNSMLIPLLPSIQKSLHLSGVQTSLILSVFSIPAALCIPGVGILSDRYGRKKLIMYSLIVMIIGSLVAASSALVSSGSFAVLMAGRVIQGIGAAGTTTLAMALTGDVFTGEKRAKVLGILEVYNGAGKVVAPIIGATAALVVWYAAFFVYPLAAGAALVGIAMYVREAKTGSDSVSVGEYLKRAIGIVYDKRKSLFPLFFVGGLGLFLLFGILYYLSFLIEETYHIDGFFKGTAFLFPLVAMTLVSYWTGQRIKTDVVLMKKLMIVGMILLFVMFGVLTVIYTLPVLMFCLTVAFGGLGFVLPCINMMITSAASDEERGFVVSIYGTVRFLGVALGPVVFEVWMHTERLMFIYSFSLLAAGGLWVLYQLKIFSSAMGRRKVVQK
ncbi:MFS transporter [Priestia megaterium]|uniref:MFS transporter n=1 Tax=Priestia megaterium TaxID=1404 RepID=UPI003B9E5E57